MSKFHPSLNMFEMADRLAAMRRQEESSTYRIHDYIYERGTLSEEDAKSKFNETNRTQMSEWCLRLSDYCGFSRETASIAMSYVDRFLCTSEGRCVQEDTKEYQLATMASMFLAIKQNERIIIEACKISKLSRRGFTESDVIRMETIILDALGWRVCGPTKLEFVQHFLQLLPANVSPKIRDVVWECARDQAELAISSYCLTLQNPSLVAFAAILNVIESIDLLTEEEPIKMPFLGAVVEVMHIDVLRLGKLQDIKKYLGELFAHQSNGDDIHAVIGAQLDLQNICSPSRSASEEAHMIDLSRSFSPVSVTATMRDKTISKNRHEEYTMSKPPLFKKERAPPRKMLQHRSNDERRERIPVGNLFYC
mmetsp:Transcript_925/g.1725  ORF Transcript_925/g.1725 Transcript_925/m.1725 type:complete len:366 (-) Transcript_925:70-1167(-)